METQPAPPKMCPDQSLVEWARQGDKDAFGVLVERHRRKCLRMATCLLRDQSDAEDEVQNAFTKSYVHLDQYHGDAEFSTWLSQIVTNQCLMAMRLRRRARFLYLDAAATEEEAPQVELPSRGPDPEGEVAFEEVKAILRTEIRRIPTMLRKALVLHDMQGMPISDVAEQLGVKVPAAKSRLLRARIELRARLMRHFGRLTNVSPLSRTAAPINRVAYHCRVTPLS
jgi:RNA polymerase sigma-70 factor, ECF subfamily